VREVAPVAAERLVAAVAGQGGDPIGPPADQEERQRGFVTVRLVVRPDQARQGRLHVGSSTTSVCSVADRSAACA
jgi:hypothetical protein